MLRYARVLYKILFTFRGYRPQKVTPASVWRWLAQFPRPYRRDLYLLLDNVIYYSEQSLVRALVQLNHQILARLAPDGIDLHHIIYVAVDKAASSSHVVLSLLKDADNLERKGATILGARDAQALLELTTKMRSGAIVYVDDFAGTGRQFLTSRKWATDYIVGAFSEFFLAPVICEEARQHISLAGVVPLMSLAHSVDQRPLHDGCTSLPMQAKSRLVELCTKMHPTFGLGYQRLATMVVFYRNAPNTMPLVLRGSLKQTPYRGVFPRSDDLPF